jgi:hypothetical protein
MLQSAGNNFVESGPLLSSTSARRTLILDLLGFEIGTVDDLILDSSSGRIAYALISIFNAPLKMGSIRFRGR